MKIGKLKKEAPLYSRPNLYKGIQNFGERNDYPQQIRELIYNSVTGYNCCNTYRKFIAGIGFLHNGSRQANKRQTWDTLMDFIARDYAMFGGFYLHLNYNALYEITQVHVMPFEMVRFSVIGDDGEFSRFAIHADWGNRNGKLRYSGEDITFIDKYNPNPEVIEQEVARAGGWHKYRGQILFYNPDGDGQYALPLYCAALTDISTEAGLCNVSYRSVRCNFLTSGILVNINSAEPETDQQENALTDTLEKLQGDMYSFKIASANVANKEEVPTFIDFKTQNFDREFRITNDMVKDRIGRAFMQPPILRSEDVGNNFGATIIENAYHLYNAITSAARKNIADTINSIAPHLQDAPSDKFFIKPLEFKSYSTQDVVLLMEQKLLSAPQAKLLMNIVDDNDVNNDGDGDGGNNGDGNNNNE
jgi:hypothetical protein